MQFLKADLYTLTETFKQGKTHSHNVTYPYTSQCVSIRA